MGEKKEIDSGPCSQSRNGACVTKQNCWKIGSMDNALNPWSGYREQTRMIKVIEASYQGDYKIALSFSSGAEGVFDGQTLLQRNGPLLEPLRDEKYFRRFFIDAGALCWPNGLELSPARLYESCRILESAH